MGWSALIGLERLGGSALIGLEWSALIGLERRVLIGRATHPMGEWDGVDQSSVRRGGGRTCFDRACGSYIEDVM